MLVLASTATCACNIPRTAEKPGCAGFVKGSSLAYYSACVVSAGPRIEGAGVNATTRTMALRRVTDCWVADCRSFSGL